MSDFFTKRRPGEQMTDAEFALFLLIVMALIALLVWATMQASK